GGKHLPEVVLGKGAWLSPAVDVVRDELEHIQARTRPGSAMQRLRIRLLQVGYRAENVVEGAVDDGVEPVLQSLQFGRLGDLEIHRDTGFVRVRPRALDSGGRCIDARGRQTPLRVMDGGGVRPRAPGEDL